MNIKNIFFAAAAAMALTACSSDDAIESVQQQSQFPEDGLMRFTTNLVDPTAALTRASFTTNTLNQEGMKIQVKVVNPNNNNYSYFTTLTYNGTEWVPATKMLWQNSTQSVQVTALSIGGSYELSQNEFENGAMGYFTSSADQSTQAKLNGEDILCMVTKTVNPQTDLVGGKIAIDFYHAMTKLDVKLELMDEFFAAGQNTANISDVKINAVIAWDIKPMEIVNEKYCYIKTRNYNSGREDFLPMKGDCTDATADSKHSFATYECIVPPQTVAAGQLTVSFKIGNRSFSWTNTEAYTLEQGKQYTLPLTVGYNTVTAPARGFTASNWENGTGGNLVTE